MLHGMKILPAQVEAFNILLKSNKLVKIGDDVDEDIIKAKSHLIKVLDNGINKVVKDLFFSAWELAYMTSYLTDIFL